MNQIQIKRRAQVIAAKALSGFEMEFFHQCNGYSNNSKEVIIAEAFTLHSLVNTVLEPNNLQHCLIVEHLVRIWSDCGCMPTDDLQSFLASPVMQYYRVLKGPGYKTPYEQREDIQKKTVAQYISEHGLAGMKKLIDTCCQYAKTGRNTWDIETGLRFAFDSIACSDIIVPAIEYYIYCDTPLCLQPLPLIEQIEDVRPFHIKHFLLLKQEEGKKPQYINDLLKVYKTFFRYLEEEYAGTD